MTADVKYNTLRQRIENEVFPRMTNEETRAGMLEILTDKRYQLASEEFAEELEKDKHLQDLIILREEFHRGQWNNMISWFRQVLDSKPYNFKRFKNVALDYARVLQLSYFEDEQKALDNDFNIVTLLPEE
ncbi:hypothetical protein KY338_06090 [Candidatus Woesearchaeota archaeon]|nr:hypothetical protein [Candidatus Woesearchaeota archaeon]MBW3005863.1 hypothetical protein [Candidatus Woesearchaeota archaeon]